MTKAVKAELELQVRRGEDQNVCIRHVQQDMFASDTHMYPYDSSLADVEHFTCYPSSYQWFDSAIMTSDVHCGDYLIFAFCCVDPFVENIIIIIIITSWHHYKLARQCMMHTKVARDKKLLGSSQNAGSCSMPLTSTGS